MSSIPVSRRCLFRVVQSPDRVLGGEPGDEPAHPACNARQESDPIASQPAGYPEPIIRNPPHAADSDEPPAW